MIFIAYNHDGYITSILSAKSESLALAYWQGANIEVFTHKCLENPEDFTPLSEHPTGVIRILKTKQETLSGFGQNFKKYLIVSK